MKIQRHKAGALLVALKAALSNDFYQTVYYQLQRDLKEGDNLHMGLQCSWGVFTKAVEEALGPMHKVKRFRNFINTKEHLRGGMSLSNTFYKCSTIVEDTFGKNNVFNTQSDQQLRSNKPTKEFHKFWLAFEVVEGLPSEFDKIKEELEISIAKYAFDPEKFFEEWTTEASTNACSKGHSVLFKDKILPQLSQTKNFRNNTTAVTDELRKQFIDAWKETKVLETEDYAMKEAILKVVEDATEDKNTPIVDLPKVREVMGKTKVCWGRFSGICRTRTMVSLPLIKKKAINKGCPNKKTILGDPDAKKLLQMKSWKMGYVMVDPPPFQKFNKGKQFQKKFSHNTATIVKTEITQEPEEEIMRANFTGQSDEEAFGPSFLYAEPEIFVEKIEIPTNTNYMKYDQYNSNNEEDEDYPPNNICYSCGQNLKWGNWCSDCGVSNEDDEETEITVTIDQSTQNAIEERLEFFATEIRNLQKLTKLERKLAIDDVEFLDDNQKILKKTVAILDNNVNQIIEWKEGIELNTKNVGMLTERVQETEDRITQIKNSDFNNGKESFRIKTGVKDEIFGYVNAHHEQIYKNISASNEDIVKLTASQNTVIKTYNKDTAEMDMNIHKLLYWKSEVTGEDYENLVKTETIGVNENTESDPESNIEEEMDIETDAEDEI